ncbi:MAG: hypothetical protein ACLFR8_07465 [Alkalispirochaeta sp.]
MRRGHPSLSHPGIAALYAVTVLFLSIVPAHGQDSLDNDDIEDSVNALLEGALTVHINARVVDEDQNETVWKMDVTRVTIGGRSVMVQMEGRNIRVVAEFTPYWESEDQLLLVAQGQTWIETERGEEPEYRTSFTTFPISLGEPILFLPLGTGHLPVDTARYGRLNIELEINVERYQS